jgi:ParB family chromosome partitioning protein
VAKRKGLGRGLGQMGVQELLGSLKIASSIQEAGVSQPGDSNYLLVDRTKLMPGMGQPRQHMDPTTLSGLADSIRAQGIIQPILVRRLGDRYEIIAGERRWRASELAGLTEVPVVVRQMSDQEAVAISLIENIQREDLNVMEEVMALKRLCDEFEMTHEMVAKAVGRSRAQVSNLLRLLKLDQFVRELLEQGHLEMGHARALLSLNPDEQRRVATLVVDQALSVRQTEQLIKQHKAAAENPVEKKQPVVVDPDVALLARELSDSLGAPVDVVSGQGGKGRLVIHYHSHEELEGVLERIR